MRRRYVESEQREWFSQRNAFLQELDGLFADAKKQRIGLKAVEARIASEKEAWYRWVLRKYPEFLAGDNLARQRELRAMLDDPDRLRNEVVATVWQGIGKPPADWSQQVNVFAAKAAAAAGDKAALKELYIREFFLDKANGHPLENADRFLDEFAAREDMKVEEIMGKIASEIQACKNAQPRRDSHRERLIDLKRAKTAYELNKKKAKSQAQAVQEPPTAGEHLYDLPPCVVCRKAVDPNDIFSCSVCQAITQMGGRRELTVYCSGRCYKIGHERHVQIEHSCAGGDKCVHLHDKKPSKESKENGKADADAASSFACTECFRVKRAVIYCTQRCAFKNISRHRHRRHGVTTKIENTLALVAPLMDVVEPMLKKENPGLRMWLVQK